MARIKNNKIWSTLIRLGGLYILWLVVKVFINSPKQSSIVVSKDLTTQEKRALELWQKMSSHKEYTQRELSYIFGIPYRSVRRYVDILVDLGKVKVKGNTRTTRIIKLK